MNAAYARRDRECHHVMRSEPGRVGTAHRLAGINRAVASRPKSERS